MVVPLIFCIYAQAYYRSTELKYHLETHDKTGFCCEVCGKSVKSSASLRKHKAKYHRNKGTSIVLKNVLKYVEFCR